MRHTMATKNIGSGVPGRKAYYRPKARQKSIMLTTLGDRVLKSASKRTRKSESDVLERLLREHGAGVEFPEQEAANG